jgi:type VI protein secretion system component VasK
LSRIAVGAHWPGEVAVGMCLGLLAGMLGHGLLLRMGPAHLRPTAWSLRAVALLLAATIYNLVSDALDFAENQPFQDLLAAVVVLSLIGFVWQNYRAIRKAKALRAS